MRRLFLVLLISFLSSLFLFLAVMTSLSVIGFRRSALSWSLEKRKQIEEQVEEELKRTFVAGQVYDSLELREKLAPIIPQGVQFVIYDENKNQVYAHRPGGAQGRRGMGSGNAPWKGSPFSERNHEPKLSIKPIERDGKIIGYYGLGTVGFAFDRANHSFIVSIRKTVFMSIAFSFVLAFSFALFSSKIISGQAKKVAEGIRQMAKGELSIRIPERGVAEVAQIAKSANSLGEKLKREEHLRSQWAADIAHDLRTPISALKSQLEGMLDGVLDPKKERIERNLGEVMRIERLVEDLSELIRLESPEMKLEPAEIDAEGFFQTLKSRFSHEISKKEVQATWERSVNILFGDEDLLQRAVSNLISNATRYAEHGGKIHIALQREEDELVFTVFNTGKTIPEGEIPRLFDRLYRGEYARKTPGAGLGLTITKQIAELHNGSVSISSKETVGTTVTMRISASLQSRV